MIELWDHQKETVLSYQGLPRCYNASDPGTGKTVATLEYAFTKKLRTLILAPKTLLEPAWLADWQKFDSAPEVGVAWALNRKKVFESGVPNVITNIEAVNFLAKKENKKYLRNFDLVVCDESTCFKNPASNRSKNAGRVFKEIEFAINMSGTPAPRTVQELWFQYWLLDGGDRLGNTISRMRYEFCTPIRPPGAPAGAIKWIDKEGSYEKVAELIADITVRHRIDECMDIPPNHISWMEYTPSPDIRVPYMEMMRHTIARMKSGELLTAANAAVARNKLLQMVSGAVYLEPNKYDVLSDERAELIADLIEDREATIVFFIWKHQRDRMLVTLAKRELEVAVIDGTTKHRDRGQIVDDFQGGKYRAILMHPETGAHGLTLTRAKTAIFASPPADRPDFLIQGIARIVRGGQDMKTETILISAKDSLERRVHNAILDKRDSALDFLTFLEELV